MNPCLHLWIAECKVQCWKDEVLNPLKNLVLPASSQRMVLQDNHKLQIFSILYTLVSQKRAQGQSILHWAQIEGGRLTFEIVTLAKHSKQCK